MVSVTFEGRQVNIQFSMGTNLIQTPLQWESDIITDAEISRLDNDVEFWNNFIPSFFLNRRISLSREWFNEHGPLTIDICTGFNMEHFPELFRGITIYGIQTHVKEDDPEIKVKIVIGRA